MKISFILSAGNSSNNVMELHASNINLGLKEVLEKHDNGDKIIVLKSFEALDIVQATISSEYSQRIANVEGVFSRTSSTNTMPMDEPLLKIVRKYGEKILLRESDRKPKASKKKGRKRSSLVVVGREKQLDNIGDWQGPPPWEVSLGGDGCPKFLCDVMVRKFFYFCLYCFLFNIKFKLLKQGQLPMKKFYYISISHACNSPQPWASALFIKMVGWEL